MGSLDRSLSYSFGAVVLALMALFLLVAAWLSFQIQDRRQDFLGTALAQSVGESVNRINPYQMRSLVEALPSKIPGLGYVAVADRSGQLLAHSRAALAGRTLAQAGLVEGNHDDVVWDGVHYWQRSLPLTGGHGDLVAGTILIGVATDDLRRDQAGFLGSLVALSLVGSLVAVGAILVLSRRFGNRMVSQLDQIIDKSPVGMATIDFATGRVLRLNKQFENTFRWNLGDLPDIDSWFVRAYPDPDYRREVQGDWAAVTADSLNKGTPVPSFLLSVHCGDGADRAVLVSTAVFDGTAVVTFVDRTEQKKAERELLDLNQSLEEKVRSRSQELERTYRELADTEKMAALGQLAAGMAHELNTPLGAIQSANGINQDYLRHRLANELKLLPTLSPPEQAYLDWLEAKNRKLAEAVPGLPDRSLRRRMVQSLAVGGWDVDDDLAEYALELGLSEGELAELALSPRKQWVFQLSRNLLVLQRMTWVVSEGVSRATHVVDALRRYLKGKDEDLARFVVADQLETILALFHHKLRLGVEVSTSFDRGAVVGDPQRLNQVWMNLIHNALQAMDFKGTLGIRVLRTAEGTVVEVADSGPGIPESIQHRIFEPYFTTKKHGEGLGLGLDLCRKIIDDHHGTLTFRSRPGETVFTVTLPAPEEP